MDLFSSKRGSMKLRFSLLLFSFWMPLSALGASRVYPAHWWKPVDKASAPSWEILPQEAGPGEVILSKRNELGILSNFTLSPFELEGERYLSVEGFWQMMKYPESETDPRALFKGLSWPHSRRQVSQMVAFEAKKAGDLGSENMKKMGIDWVTYRGERMEYRSPNKGKHYQIIRRAMAAKLQQNPEVRRVLQATGDLILRPDHHQPTDAPPAWKYFQIWMELRSELLPPSSL